jgi:S1-C subfamily serine protease
MKLLSKFFLAVLLLTVTGVSWAACPEGTKNNYKGECVPIAKSSTGSTQAKSSTGSTQYPTEYIKNVVENAKHFLSDIQSSGKLDTEVCMFGYTFTDDLKIINVFWKAKKAGLRPGDIILEINNKKIPQAEDVLPEVKKYLPGDEIVFQVNRSGRRKSIKAPCGNGLEFHTVEAKILQSMIDQDWNQCLSELRAQNIKYEVSETVRFLNYWLDCVTGIRTMINKPIDREYVRLVYDRDNARIKEASHSGEELNRLRSWVLGEIDWLTKAGYELFAGDLKGQYERALQSLPSSETAAAIPSDRLRLIATGTGFAISEHYLLTASHVVDDCEAVSTRHLHEDTDVEIAALDSTNDLGLLKSAESFEHTAKFRGGKAASLGDTVVNYGYPLFGALSDHAKISKGEINSLAGVGNDSSVMQYDAATQPGNSGGPVLDLSGNVVGVVNSMLSKEYADATGYTAQNVNFAVKSYVAEGFLSSNGVDYETAEFVKDMKTSDIAEKAERFTVLVGCWQ